MASTASTRDVLGATLDAVASTLADEDASAVERFGRKLLGTTPALNWDPANQVYVFMFALAVILFSVPPLLKLKRVLYPDPGEPEEWDYEAELEDL